MELNPMIPVQFSRHGLAVEMVVGIWTALWTDADGDVGPAPGSLSREAVDSWIGDMAKYNCSAVTHEFTS